MAQTCFFEKLADRVKELGGFHNAHLHIDRSHTLSNATDAKGPTSSHVALQQKHALIPEIHHSQLYEQDCLRSRINQSLDMMVACNTRRADSVIDVTDDGLGLRALETALEISHERSHEIDFRTAVYSPLGFRDDEPNRWRLIEQGATLAHLIGSLPERDDQTDYPEHIGYQESCRRVLELAVRHQKEVQIHTDQVNHPNENGTERLLDIIDAEKVVLGSRDAPMIWAVHMISPSQYDEGRWSELVSRLRAANMGVICCPSAAIGMRQIRGVLSPIGNSIVRVLELCAAGVPVRLGSDNIADMLSPSTTADLTDEVFLLSAALRFYDVNILAKLACGVPLNASEVDFLKQHIEANNVEMAKTMERWQSPS